MTRHVNGWFVIAGASLLLMFLSLIASFLFFRTPGVAALMVVLFVCFGLMSAAADELGKGE